MAIPEPTPDLLSGTGPEAAGFGPDRDASVTDAAGLAKHVIPGIGDWALPPQDAGPASLFQTAATTGPEASGETTDAPQLACVTDCLPAARPARWADHVPAESAQTRGFWKQAGKVKWEAGALFAYFTAHGIRKLTKETRPFRFKDEGWFGKDTASLGVDKLGHAYNTYLFAELLHHALHDRTAASEGDALTASALAVGLVAFNELNDGIERDGGFSMNDIAMNLAGAGFSLLRNTVPGMKEKVAFKLEVVPNSDIYTVSGKRHYEQQRFFFALKGSGFEGLKRSPLRYLDLQVGYYASDFTNRDRLAGREPKRHVFAGIGLNLGELLFGKSRSGAGKVAREVLDYWQPPYTSVRADTTGRVGS